MNTKQALHILNLNLPLEKEKLKKSYKKLAIIHHPDRNNGSKISEEKMKEINAAFKVLLEQIDTLSQEKTQKNPEVKKNTSEFSSKNKVYQKKYEEKKDGEKEYTQQYKWRTILEKIGWFISKILVAFVLKFLYFYFLLSLFLLSISFSYNEDFVYVIRSDFTNGIVIQEGETYWVLTPSGNVTEISYHDIKNQKIISLEDMSSLIFFKKVWGIYVLMISIYSLFFLLFRKKISFLIQKFSIPHKYHFLFYYSVFCIGLNIFLLLSIYIILQFYA